MLKMTSKFVRQYFTQDFLIEEKQSYIKYLLGDESENIWMKKALLRREPLLVALETITCGDIGSDDNSEVCKEWINVRENGTCKCSKGHYCYDVVIREIKKIMAN